MRARPAQMARLGSWSAGVLLVAAAMAAAGCSSSSSSSTTQPAASASSASGAQVTAPSSAPASATATATASASASASATATAVKTGTSSLGTILTSATGRSLYLFEKDASGKSACYGACAQGWPPLLTTGAPTAAAGVSASLLGTAKRTDGTVQVTYAGHPLYYFVADTKAGDIRGQNVHAFGADWYLVSPAGKKVEKPGS
jgi:predicted lipoprotein with Yx(FWY)xxD motif